MESRCPRCEKSLPADLSDNVSACPHCGVGLRVDMTAETVELAQVSPAGKTVDIEAAGPSPSVPRSAAATTTRTHIDGHEILGKLGRGGFGVVYKVRQASLDRVVALKLLIAGEDATEKEIRRFAREARSLANVSHKNIVQVYDMRNVGHEHYQLLELVDGRTLAEEIRAGKIEPRRAMDYTEQVAQALDHAHQEGVIHRDLKPGNIMITTRGWPKVMDFGLAKEVGAGSGFTLSGTVLGTPQYMSPEQAEGRSKNVDARSDIYALGAVLYEMLTGATPFSAESLMALLHMIVEKEPAPPRSIDPTVPPDAERICLRCLEKEPERRYQTASALAADCRRFLQGLPVSSRRGLGES